MVLNAGNLDRRIQIRRAAQVSDGLGGFQQTWADHGPPIAARRRDVSDSERMIAGGLTGELRTRFVIRATPFGRSVRRSDRLVHEGVTFRIDGIKEVPDSRRAFLEITAETEDAA